MYLSLETAYEFEPRTCFAVESVACSYCNKKNRNRKGGLKGAFTRNIFYTKSGLNLEAYNLAFPRAVEFGLI